MVDVIRDDDSIEFFGGTVNVKHLVLTQNEDDGFDTDNGWQGKAQFVVIQHVAPRGTDASNGYESDNHAAALHMVTMQGGVFGCVSDSRSVIEATTRENLA
mgnify:CR=1 FL=1